MFITYHEAKRLATLRDRGLDFKDARRLLMGDSLTQVDDRRDYGEVRLQTLGWLDGLLIMVVWTQRGNAAHIISMRRCNERERRGYGDRLGKPRDRLV